MTQTPPHRLRDLDPLPRLGLVCIVLTLLGGTLAAGTHLYLHQQNRDERPGLSIDDIKAHYHGISSPAPLLEALKNGHPETLDAGDRQTLIDWLEGDRVSADYDNLDLGDAAPSEIIADNCLACHSRSSTGENAAPAVPLDYFDDVEPLSISRDIRPVSVEILAASTHTHALALSALTLILCWLGLHTSWPRPIVGVLVALTGLGLLTDIASWWLTREWIGFAWAIAIGGGIFDTGAALLGLLVIADLLMPRDTTRS